MEDERIKSTEGKMKSVTEAGLWEKTWASG